MKKVLDPKGYRVSLDDGSVACEIWLRNKVPAQPKKDSPGALYTQLAESALVGVISFPQPTTDYRGQSIRKGTYTLRYELIPNDGNHLSRPNRDFVLMVPAASDENLTPHSILASWWQAGKQLEPSIGPLSRRLQPERHGAAISKTTRSLDFLRRDQTGIR